MKLAPMRRCGLCLGERITQSAPFQVVRSDEYPPPRGHLLNNGLVIPESRFTLSCTFFAARPQLP